MCEPCLPSTHQSQPGMVACEPCELHTTSNAASASCDLCVAGRYHQDNLTASTATCQSCPVHAQCIENHTTLSSILVDLHHWRSGPKTARIYGCLRRHDGGSNCVGSSSPHHTHNAYCVDGAHGPLCEVCETSKFFDSSSARCKSCDAEKTAVIGVVVLVLFLGVFVAWTRLILPRLSRGTFLTHRAGRIQKIGLTLLQQLKTGSILAPAKIIFSFIQLVAEMTSIYDVPLPSSWTLAFQTLHVARFELVAPECVGGFYNYLLLRTTIPVAIMLLTNAISVALLAAHAPACTPKVMRRASLLDKLRAFRSQFRRHQPAFLSAAPSPTSGGPLSEQPQSKPQLSHARSSNPKNLQQLDLAPSATPRGKQDEEMANKRPSSFKQAAFNASPINLLIIYVLVGVISADICKAWSCKKFETSSESGEYISRLRSDMLIDCGSGAHAQIKTLALGLLGMWPITVMVAFGALLAAAHNSIRHRRPTRFSSSLAFLHRDFHPEWYFWELINLLERLVLLGLVLIFVPDNIAFIRLLVGWLVSVIGLIAHVFASPYRTPACNLLAVAVHLAQCCLFVGAMLLKIHVEFAPFLVEFAAGHASARFLVMGFASSSELSIVVYATTFGLIGVTLAAILVHAVLEKQQTGLLEEYIYPHSKAKQIASLTPVSERWHLFLSQLWSGDRLCDPSALRHLSRPSKSFGLNLAIDLSLAMSAVLLRPTPPSASAVLSNLHLAELLWPMPESSGVRFVLLASSWHRGQDQVNSIRRQLGILLPTCRIFMVCEIRFDPATSLLASLLLLLTLVLAMLLTDSGGWTPITGH